MVRPVDSAIGYAIQGDLYYPDARMIGAQLRVVGSLGNGVPRFNEWIDFSTQRIDLRTLRPPLTFAFNHPTLLAMFKDPGGESGAPAEIIVNQTAQTVDRPYFVAEDSLMGPFRGERLGIYSEATDPTNVIARAQSLQTRVLLVHDAMSPWTIPTILRPWDIPAMELYRGVGEDLSTTVARWIRLVRSMLDQWPGDCGVVPQFYCMGGAPPNEVWTVSDVLAGLDYLSDIVNHS